MLFCLLLEEYFLRKINWQMIKINPVWIYRMQLFNEIIYYPNQTILRELCLPRYHLAC